MSQTALLQKPRTFFKKPTIFLKKSYSSDIFANPFLQELARQIIARDTFGIYRNYSYESLLQLLIVSPQESERSKRDIFSQKRIFTFYNTIAARVEQKTGKVTKIFINFNPEGLGSVLIFCGNVLVTSQVIRNAQNFGFDSLEELANEGDRITNSALELAKSYFNFSSFS
jgi:probable nitrogen fixation protein